ncbi:MAG: archaellin/type IV pilin N-terminal domain-containing protein [Candidatus Aenigmatarchaeota archaeon]
MMQKNSRPRKAISPLIATVLLISFTFTIAAILAGWGQNIVTQSTGKSEKIQQQFAACSGGIIQFVDTGLQNPMMEGTHLKAQIKVDGVPLGNFTFVVFLTGLETRYISDSTGASLAPGPRNIGTIISQPTDISRDNITSVMITSNCTDAKTVSRPVG